MRRSKKPLQQFDNSRFLSAGDDDKRFGRIYAGLLQSKRWEELSPSAKLLYVIAVTHVGTPTNYRTLKWYREHEAIPETMCADGSFLILTRDQLQGYGIRTHKYSERFGELCKAGFLEVVHRNAHRKLPNLYRLSTAWKETEETR